MVNLPLLLFPKWVQKVIAQSNEVTLVLKSPQDLHPVL